MKGDMNMDFQDQMLAAGAFPAGWTEEDERSYRDWIDSTLEGQQEIEQQYWNARAAEYEQRLANGEVEF
jgi:hypothetical protein